MRSRGGAGWWRTDALGQALVMAPSDNPWLELTGPVLVEARWVAPTIRVPIGAATVEVRLLERGGIRGQVLAESGEALAELEVCGRSASGEVLERTVTDTMGHFALRLRGEVDGAVCVALTGYRVGLDTRTELRSTSRWSGATEVVLPHSQRVVIRARAEDREAVEFQVRGPGGEAAASAIVVIRPHDVGEVWTGRCDAAGRWLCEDLAPGVAFGATARPPDKAARELGWWSSPAVEGVAGRDRTLALRIAQALRLRGRIERGDRSEAGRVTVRIAGEDGRSFGLVRAGVEGTFSVWIPEHAFPVTLHAHSDDGTEVGSAWVGSARDAGAEVVVALDVPAGVR